MRSHSLRIAAVILSVATLAAIAGTCQAAPPSSIDRLARTTSLSSQDRAAIDAFAEYWANQLFESDAEPTGETMRRVRSRLIDPLRVPGVTPVFRDAYSRALVPQLTDRIEDGGSARPIETSNAVIVLSKIGTEQALRELVELTSPDDEQRGHVRLAAARGCADALRNAQLATINPNKITSSARSLRDAVRRESDPRAMHHQLDALHAADRATLPSQTRSQVRNYLVEALDAVAERASRPENGDAESDPSNLLEATRPVLNHLRNAYLDPLNLDPNAQREFGQKLGPSLGRLLESANENWAVMQSTPEAKEKLRRFIFLCEGFLTMIDATVRTPPPPPPNTKMHEAWEAGDVDRYRKDLAEWQDVLKRY